MSITGDLASTPLFRHLELVEVDRLARQCREAVVESGEPLIVLGDIQDAFQIIVAGQVSVTRPIGGRDREVARLGAGSFVGEMALFTDEPATATVTAVSRSRVVEVPRAVVDELAKEPRIAELFGEIVRRRQATNRLEEVAPLAVEARDGTALLLRPLWPDDWRLMDTARDRVSDDALRQRFFTLPKVHEAFLRRLAQVDYLDQFAWAVLDDDGASIAAVGRYGRQPDDPSVAEMALLVADDLQRQGLGGLLTVALAAAAQAHGIESFTATAMADNKGVQTLLERFGAVWGPGDRGQEVTATWPVKAVLSNARVTDPVDGLQRAATAILQP